MVRCTLSLSSFTHDVKLCEFIGFDAVVVLFIKN